MKGPFCKVIQLGGHRVRLFLGTHKDNNIQQRMRRSAEQIGKQIDQAGGRLTSAALKEIAVHAYKEEGFVQVDT